MGFFDKLRAGRKSVAGTNHGSVNTREQDALRLVDEGNGLEQEGRLAEALGRYVTAIELAPDLARPHLNRGNVLLEMGDAAGALEAYATALVRDPTYAAAHYNTGNAHMRAGRAEASVDAYRSAISLKPDFVEAEAGLGIALEDLGRLEDAAASYMRALALKPDYAEIHGNLGNVWLKLGRFDDAVATYRRAAHLRPQSAEAHNNLGRALEAQGQHDSAVESFRRAVELDPGNSDAQCNLGNALYSMGLLSEALACHRRAVEVRPGSAEAHSNVGIALKDLGRFDEAVASLRRALEINSGVAGIHFNLGNVLHDLGRLQDATKSFRRALELDPDYADAHCNLGNALYGLGLLNDARACYRRTLELNPNHVLAHNNLGNALSALGYPDDAVGSYQEALRLDPDFFVARSNLLFGLNYRPGQGGAAMLEEARRYGDLARRKAHPFTDWTNARDPLRRLRVGFVSGDLRNHAVGHFVKGALASLASEAADRLEIVGYPTHFLSDSVTEGIKACCSGWHSAVRLSDREFAQRIRDDGIDVLIDLSGHTQHNRLPMFAWKPAPVQATWLGYLATTGVTAIDYVIADHWTLPESDAIHFTERIWRLPTSYLCFTPPDGGSKITPLPALRNRRITFGSFNNLAKMNDDVVALWARVLTAMPESQLFLKAKPFEELSVQQKVRERFGAHGIEATRLILAGHVQMSDYLAPYQQVDISLDPFPYTGITTSVESLWTGVPVLTLAGETFLSRQGVGLLMNAGLADWIASDSEDYVARAVAHASDLPRLASLRGGLRERMLSSPIFDTVQFADHFAAAIRGMWQQWCNQTDGMRSDRA